MGKLGQEGINQLFGVRKLSDEENKKNWAIKLYPKAQLAMRRREFGLRPKLTCSASGRRDSLGHDLLGQGWGRGQASPFDEC